jgi:hypothetical protein
MDMNSRMAMAEKLSVQQLQQAIQSGSLPAYIGIPLIEQKNKEKSQMAAAQQGQQKPPSVVASILQQADQQEQQEQGIDQLPSNLPTEQDEEMGMAGGGIVAFAAGTPEGVKDPEQDPRIIALRQDPNYLNFVAHGGNKGGDTSLEAFLQAGNAAPVTAGGPEYEPSRRPSPSRGSYDRPGPVGDLINSISSASKRAGTVDSTADPLAPFSGTTPEALTADADRVARLKAEDADRVARLKAEDAAAKAAQKREFLSKAAPHLLPRQADANLDNQMLVDSNNGVAALPSAKLAPEGTPGAPRPASTANIPLTTDEMRSQVASGKGSALDQYADMLMKERGSSAKDRQQAKGMAIFQAGLGIAGGTSPNAFANIAQGSLPAIQAYQQELKGLRAEDRDRIKQLMELGISKEKLAMELRKLGIEDKRVNALVNLYNSKAAGGGSGDDNKKNIAYNTATTSYNKTVGEIDKAIGKFQEDPIYKLGGNSPLKKGIQDKIDALEQRKANTYKQYRGFITDKVGIDIPDFSDPTGGDSKGSPMPKTKGELKIGETYNTAKGLAKWDGNQFVSGR